MQRWLVKFVTHHMDTKHKTVVLVVSHDQRRYFCKLEVTHRDMSRLEGEGRRLWLLDINFVDMTCLQLQRSWGMRLMFLKLTSSDMINLEEVVKY